MAETKVTKTTAVKKPAAPKTTKVKKETKPAVKALSKDLPASLFGSEKIYKQAIFDVVISDRASKRQGTHKVKNRGEVSGTGKKPWQQKGTGRARTGSLKTPVFVGGGRAFGPTPDRNYKLKVNKKVRKNALISALTLLAQGDKVLVSEIKMDKISTKELVAQLTKHKANNLKTLIVTNETNVFLSARNLPRTITTKVTSISVEDLLWADKLIISKQDIAYLEGLVK
ncbi:50S ribosomal protein L4 [Mycoplasmopsis californica]|uniref:Large ribosomal subunit protein uL4 n=1 Tax=Mycoplasmopsis equigenitalium TaxID=114883 RepID=A0ABY5J5C9_9BACT|nr:50S ribosomal protein L4 [Mycoplasmopsis equigenitalium]UUD37086.1 50S ribosomal protein L4 [Mycoplasmopsis equigenitalium]VEU69613.1 50S ribosomal protein L4 [Mycoplasmopsis californica]